MPGSPEINTIWPSPSLAHSQRRSSSSISASRPISGVSDADRNASKRLATVLGRSTCQTGTGVCSPLTGYSEIAIVEQVAQQPSCGFGDDHAILGGHRLQAGGE